MKFVKPLIVSAAIVVPTLLASATVNAAEVSGNVALTTDYRFRGISQSDSAPSIQGGFDVAFDSGLYMGTWGAAVDFDSSSDVGLNGGIELDYYIGYGSDIGESGVSFDIGYIYYDYPQDEALLGDYQELYGALSLSDFTVGINYSDDYWGEAGKFYYVYGSYSIALPNDFSLDLLIGQGNYDEVIYLSEGADTHINWVVGVSKSLADLDFTLAYEDTDLSEAETYGYDWAQATVIFTVAKSL
jgi:uncharacterized protein (TIGR02001 family)|tara:strand:- start:97 stop:825 length:729 start_codon:yes stop_codon:yes gene_type:complete